MQLFVVRHGESANNALTDVSKRSRDPKLTQNGEEQIVHAAQFLAAGRHLTPEERRGGGPYLDNIFCSPMWRCMRTAQPIGEATGLTPEVWVDIHESGGIYLDHGTEGGVVGYSGMTLQEMHSEFPGYEIPEGVSDQGWWNRGFEEVHLCHGRAMGVVAVLQRWAGQDHAAGRPRRLALVSHGGFMHSFLMALGLGLPGNGLSFYHNNTAIDRIDVDAEGHLHVVYVNRVTHLPDVLITD